MQHTAHIGMGSNLGDRERNIRSAIRLLAERAEVEVAATSALYETEAWPKGPKGRQPDFLNCALKIKTSLSPENLLAALQGIEQSLGRPRRRAKRTPRAIDLDILFYDDLVLNRPHLEIPHPELQKRLFVLVPLCDISPTLIHPVHRKPLKLLLEELKNDEPGMRVERRREE